LGGGRECEESRKRARKRRAEGGKIEEEYQVRKKYVWRRKKKGRQKDGEKHYK
jgi:hypothetical protein